VTRLLRGLPLILLVALAGCASPARRPAVLLSHDHPLAGRIWDVAAARFVDRAALASELARARFVLLGERHDNPEHHRLQAWVVQALGEAGRRPAVGFEMLTLDQADALRTFLAGRPRDGAGLGEAVGWAETGWPEWSMYEPIADAALAADLPILATNLPPAISRDIRRRGVDALDPALVARVGLDRPLPEESRTALAAEIRDSHCGYAPADLLDGMVTAQRARDGQMADALAAGGDRDGAVLIAGSGHVREDWGVPAYLARRVPGAGVATIGFVEVDDRTTEPTAYAAHFGGRLPFDYVWFTPRLDSEDPCEAFKRSLEKMRERRP
jgi:uncharacterized iron-regulated protein